MERFIFSKNPSAGSFDWFSRLKKGENADSSSPLANESESPVVPFGPVNASVDDEFS